MLDGKVILWEMMNCHKDRKVNPLVPVRKGYPLELVEAFVQHVKSTLQDMGDKMRIITA